MRFNNLQLRNIGAFHGPYEFDLRTTNNQQNTVLIGGKNGSGKTTILEAVRLALFGPFVYGLKTESNTYSKMIDAKLNSIAKKENEPSYYVYLEVEVVENLQKRNYTIKRNWYRNAKSIKESVIVLRDGEMLKEREADIFLTKLQEETPPQLLEFCLFDGERISQIISNETLSSYLSETARVVFNLDLFESLENDMNTMIKQEALSGNLSAEEEHLRELGEKLNALNEQLNQYELRAQDLTQSVQDKQAAVADMNRQFEVHGGLLKEQLDHLHSEINRIEKERYSMMEQTKEKIATLLPFALVQGNLANVLEQMQHESLVGVKDHVQELLAPNDVQELVKSLFSKREIATPNSQDFSHDLYNGLLDLLSCDDTTIIHQASNKQRSEVESLYHQVLDFDPQHEIGENYKRNQAMLKKINKLKKKVEEAEKTSDLHDLMAQIYKLKAEIDMDQKTLDEMRASIESVQQEIADKEREFESTKSKIIHVKKTENIFTVANRVLDISSAFRLMQLKKKLQHVELETVRMLQLLFRKDLFVTHVKIDPESFHLRLFDSEQEEIDKEVLSAGEKQILLLSTVWAMVKCSRRRIPFVFDTLLGRLDETHKGRVLTELIPRCGEQVIILSTDSEINEVLFPLIASNVAKTYTIDFDTTEKNVRVSDQYFSFSAKEALTNELSS
ncbi:MAG TPA: DNA sulfur modification protein DndD [Bacilli bacterium]|nr:DNA sulfur modification protein DndD [Bacilli bacterium]